MEISVEGRKGSLKKSWLDAIESDMKTAGICVDDIICVSSGGFEH